MLHPLQKIVVIAWLCWLPVMAEAAQICRTDSIPATTPDSQLTDNADGTVTDTKTGLMWKQCSEGLSGTSCATGIAQPYTWAAALNRAQTVNTLEGGFAGYTDWRLPNLKELQSITEKQCVAPAINLTRFPNTAAESSYWSSSPVAAGSNSVWGVMFNNGNDGWNTKSGISRVRLVRTNQ